MNSNCIFSNYIYSYPLFICRPTVANTIPFRVKVTLQVTIN